MELPSESHSATKARVEKAAPGPRASLGGLKQGSSGPQSLGCSALPCLQASNSLGGAVTGRPDPAATETFPLKFLFQNSRR